MKRKTDYCVVMLAKASTGSSAASRILALGLLCTATMAQPGGPRQADAGSKNSTARDALKAFLRVYFQQEGFDKDETTRCAYAFVDLNGDGNDEAIVHVTGRTWYGTGGCQLYILTPDRGSYRFVARVPATRPPIRVLDNVRNGWHSIAIIVREDSEHIYEEELRFNGRKYPLGAWPRSDRLPGKVVIADSRGETLLFP